jgi:hypothetical protein
MAKPKCSSLRKNLNDGSNSGVRTSPPDDDEKRTSSDGSILDARTKCADDDEKRTPLPITTVQIRVPAPSDHDDEFVLKKVTAVPIMEIIT